MVHLQPDIMLIYKYHYYHYYYYYYCCYYSQDILVADCIHYT